MVARHSRVLKVCGYRCTNAVVMITGSAALACMTRVLRLYIVCWEDHPNRIYPTAIGYCP